MGRISTTLVAGFFCLGLTGALEAQGEFSYGFQDAPAGIQAEAGATVPFQIKLVLEKKIARMDNPVQISLTQSFDFRTAE